MNTLAVTAASRGQLGRIVRQAIDGKATLLTRSGKPAAYVLPASLIDELLEGALCDVSGDSLGDLLITLGSMVELCDHPTP